MIYNLVVEFSDWITQKYVEWRGDAIGRERSITEYAKYLGVSQQLMSNWMKKGGKVPRSIEMINKLVAAYGNEVYDVLGLEIPTGNAQLDTDFLPPEAQSEFKRDLREFVKQWMENHGYRQKK